VSRVAVLLPAGGSGTRMGGACKPLLDLAGETILSRCMRPFLDRADVEWLVVALPAAALEEPPAWLPADPRVRLVKGGPERMASVRLALEAVPDEADVIVVHDAARPLVTADVIDRCIAAAAAGRSVLAAVPVTDTIQEIDDGGAVVATPDRSRLRAAQTPQAFPAGVLRDAHARAALGEEIATDDAGLVSRFGGRVHVVDGSPANIKITTPVDLLLAEAILADRR
jgi:2-C-methyl-D-erythritol 4-phosphate cytidylyltransferase